MNLKLIHVLFAIILAMVALPCGLHCVDFANAPAAAGITHDQANCYRAMEVVAEQEGWNDITLYHVIERECK